MLNPDGDVEKYVSPMMIKFTPKLDPLEEKIKKNLEKKLKKFRSSYKNPSLLFIKLDLISKSGRMIIIVFGIVY
jgi:hypothetical protein